MQYQVCLDWSDVLERVLTAHVRIDQTVRPTPNEQILDWILLSLCQHLLPCMVRHVRRNRQAEAGMVDDTSPLFYTRRSVRIHNDYTIHWQTVLVVCLLHLDRCSHSNYPSTYLHAYSILGLETCCYDQSWIQPRCNARVKKGRRKRLQTYKTSYRHSRGTRRVDVKTQPELTRVLQSNQAEEFQLREVRLPWQHVPTRKNELSTSFHE